ncbi:MAG: ECF transporter S component [Chloroflexota bacterium]
MTNNQTTNSNSWGLRSWKTTDILTLVAIVIGLAVVSFVSSYARTVLEAALGPFGNRIVMVVNIVILFTVPFLIRKPLAAIIGALLLGLVQLPFSPFGLISIVGFLVGGIITELIFAAGRYRRYGLGFLLVAGVAYNLITLAFVWVPLQIGALGPVGLVGIFMATLIGGLLGGWITKLIGDGLIQSGVMT